MTTISTRVPEHVVDGLVQALTDANGLAPSVDVRAAVDRYVSEGATAKQAVALFLRNDAAESNKVGAAAASIAWGTEVKPGGFGNLYTTGMRAIGRGDEIESTGATGVGKGVVAILTAKRDALQAALDNVTGKVDEAEAALKALDTKKGRDEAVKSRVSAIEAKVAELVAERDALEADPSAWLDTERTRRTEAVDQARDRVGERREAIEAELATANSMLAMAGGIEG